MARPLGSIDMKPQPRKALFYIITSGNNEGRPGHTGQAITRYQGDHYLVEWLAWQDGTPIFCEFVSIQTMADERWMIFTDKDLWIRRMAEVSQPRVVVEGDDEIPMEIDFDDEDLPQGGTAFNPPPVDSRNGLDGGAIDFSGGDSSFAATKIWDDE